MEPGVIKEQESNGPATQSQSRLWSKRKSKITEARKGKMPEGKVDGII